MSCLAAGSVQSAASSPQADAATGATSSDIGLGGWTNHDLFDLESMDTDSEEFEIEIVRKGEELPGWEDEEICFVDEEYDYEYDGWPILSICMICGTSDCEHKTSECPYLVLATELDDSKDIAPCLKSVQSIPAEVIRRLNNEVNFVRLTNLPNYICQHKLYQQFSKYGHVSCASVPLRGIGFVSFFDKEDAQRAIKELNLPRYEHLALD